MGLPLRQQLRELCRDLVLTRDAHSTRLHALWSCSVSGSRRHRHAGPEEQGTGGKRTHTSDAAPCLYCHWHCRSSALPGAPRTLSSAALHSSSRSPLIQSRERPICLIASGRAPNKALTCMFGMFGGVLGARSRGARIAFNRSAAFWGSLLFCELSSVQLRVTYIEQTVPSVKTFVTNGNRRCACF